MTDYSQPGWLRPDPAADARFPAIGFCPCPGKRADAARVAEIVVRTGKTLGDIAQVLNGTGRGEWKGKAAEAFREQFQDDFRPKVNDARDSFTDAGRALDDWVRYMREHQAYAEKLESEAQDAKAKAAGIQRELDGMPPKPGFGERLGAQTHEEKAKREREEERRSGKEKSLHAANADLEEIRGRAERLRERYIEEGGAIADRLKHAMDIAPNEPGIWDKIGEAIAKFAEMAAELGEAILDDLKDFLKEYAWVFEFIGNVAGFASTVLGLMSLVPGLQFLAAPALILGAVALGSHYLEKVGKSGSFIDALTDPTVVADAAALAFGFGAYKAGSQLGKLAGASPYGFFRGVLTQPGHVLEGAEFGLKVAQFGANWGANTAALGPGGGAQLMWDVGKYAIPGDQTKGPGEDVWPEALTPEPLRDKK
ncbi:WXG100 family type VII secretion target [Streptomyces olivaceus]|uniref:WXG100 family type VII secretion target n=1 Tax=Streptomyces olivaceus TaxID=47716 RepID=UPI0033A114E4